MKKNIINVDVSWSGDNFCCSWADRNGGVVLVTDKSFQKLKDDFKESVCLHIQSCVEDGDILPDYQVDGNYDIEFNLDAAALIRSAESFTTMSVISRVSGINQKQLSHYANGVKRPRPVQIARIKAQAEIPVHEISRKMLNLCHENIGSILDVLAPRAGRTV